MTKKNYTSEFKVKVVLEVLKEDYSLSEIASGYGINPNLVSRWKQEFLENAPKIYERTAQQREESKISKEMATEKAQMLKKIGQLTMERDYLKSATEKIADRRLL
jgi:putative transposase